MKEGDEVELSDFLGRLRGVKGGGNQYSAQCPAHDDQHASLSVSTGQDGRILVKCNAGCTNPAILSALGLTWGDVFQKPSAVAVKAADSGPTVTTAKPVAVYDYKDAAGNLLARKTRWANKGFGWSRPDGKGGWIKGRGDTPKTLYNLSIASGFDTVYIVEGEKDVDTLTAQGKVATCNPDGAGPGKWLPEFSEALKGKTCFIIPDHDKPGKEHAESVARSLYGVAASVKLLNLAQIWAEIPEHGDVTDYLEWYARLDPAQGATMALTTLGVLADNAPEYVPDAQPAEAGDIKEATSAQSTLISLDQVTPEPPRYFWEPYIRLHNLNIVRGDGGVGKTMFIMALAAAVTTGKMPEGMPGLLTVEQGAVIYYGAEDEPSECAHRAVLCECERKNLFVIGEGNMLPRLSDLSTFRQQIQQTGAKLIVLDPLQSFLGADADMNKANEVRPMLDGLRAMCQELACTVIIVEHMNKASHQKAQYRGLGSVDIINASRSTLMVGWHPQEKGFRVVIPIKANAKHGPPIAFTIDDNGKFVWKGVCDTTEDEVANARQFKSAPAETAIDPVLALVLALMEKYPDGWKGTADQMLAEGSGLVDCSLLTKSNAIGMKLPGIHRELVKRGITWTKVKRTHCFSKRPQLTLMKQIDEDGQRDGFVAHEKPS
jgi:5S rRNA maturation endonuclease (ribonuclease M5)